MYRLLGTVVLIEPLPIEPEEEQTESGIILLESTRDRLKKDPLLEEGWLRGVGQECQRLSDNDIGKAVVFPRRNMDHQQMLEGCYLMKEAELHAVEEVAPVVESPSLEKD